MRIVVKKGRRLDTATSVSPEPVRDRDGAVFISVQPRFANPLMSGEKTAEIRRRFPLGLVGSEVFVYSTSPQQAVLGRALIASLDRLSVESVWGHVGPRLQIERGDLDRYLAGAEHVTVISLRSREWFSKPVSLKTLRELGVRPPQNYRYLDEALATVLRGLGRARGGGHGPAR